MVPTKLPATFRRAGLPVAAFAVLVGALALRWAPWGVAVPVSLAAGVALGWYLERRILGAARAMAESIERLASEDLRQAGRPIARYPELRDLVGPFERVRAALEAQRRSEEEALATTRRLSNLSHELRTPLTGVLGLTELLQQTRLDGRQRLLLQSMHDSADLLLTLLNDLIDLGRMDESALQLESVDFDLRRAVMLVTHVLQPQARSKRIELETWLGPELPSAVRGDPARLQQVLFNLVGNAVKFTESGSVRVEVHPEPIPDGVSLRFDVVDTGIGIDPEDLPRLFRRFDQGSHSTHRSFGGSGLGLTLAKQLVELMGGTLEVQSRVGVGTRFAFQIQLPLGDRQRVRAHRGELLSPDASAQPAPGWARGLKLLIAEDHEMNRQMLRLLSEQEGFVVSTAEHGVAAVEAAKMNAFDLVLMDVHMPKLDGIKATQAIRKLTPPNGSALVLALTADAGLEHHPDYADSGMDGFLLKPFHRDAFVQMAHGLLRQRGRVSADVPPPPALVDTDRLAHLVEHLKPEDLMRLIDRFAERARAEVDSLTAAMHEQDTERTHAQAHRLAGFAANFGAHALAQWAHQVEREGAGSHTADELRDLTEATLAELDRWTWKGSQTAPMGS